MTAVAVQTQPQVFLSFAEADREFASDVAALLTRSGVSVVRMDEVEPAREYSSAVRKALRDSNAVVVVLSTASRQRQMPASVLFEIGAATGAEKPIFVIVDEASGTLPFNVPDLETLPISRVEEIAQRIRRGGR